MNSCYKVETLQGDFALRIGKEDSGRYGFSRNEELKFYLIAENLGLAPHLRTYDLLSSVLVMDYIDGELVDDVLVRSENVLPKIVAALKRLHSRAPTEYQEPSIFSFIQAQMEKLKSLNFLPEEWEGAIKKIVEESRFCNPLVCCHNDLAFNMLIEKDRVWFIDWESAGWNDPLFDLAPLCIWYNFSELEQKQLLTLYFGELKQEKELGAAIRLVCIFHALWSYLEVAYGNESYKEQAQALFAKAKCIP